MVLFSGPKKDKRGFHSLATLNTDLFTVNYTDRLLTTLGQHVYVHPCKTDDQQSWLAVDQLLATC